MTAALAHPGFADPVHDSQACFRAVLDAMSRPGQVHRVMAAMDPPPGLDPATAAVLLTLVDAETPLWLDAAAEAIRGWVAFHCGAPTSSMADAAIGCAWGPVALDAFQAGTDDAPELGATLVLQVASLDRGRALRLAGPGLAAPAVFRVEGLDDGFVEQWAANRERFPRGVDVILCAGDLVAALPRTVSVGDA